jgi:predicted permease
MAWRDGLHDFWSVFLRRGEVERELDEELLFHIEQETEKQIAAGLLPEEAKRAALVSFGGVERFKEEVRDERGRLIDDLCQDVRVGLRGLWKSPGFAAVAVLSMALGIGANTAIFSVVHGVLLRPLVFRDSQELVSVWIEWPEFGGPLSEADLTTWIETQNRFAAVGAYSRRKSGFTLIASEGPRIVNGAWLSRTLPEVLGVEPILGRGFAADDESVALIGQRLWLELFAGEESAVGSIVELDGKQLTIVGVMPPEFAMPGQVREDVWPLLEFGEPERRGPFYLVGVGRLRTGVDLAAAGEDLARTRAIVQERYPDFGEDWRYGVEPLRQAVVGDANKTLWLLMGAVSLVLLIAVANVANLLLSRSTIRVRETAIRTALGAAPIRLLRQLLTEAGLLGLLGSVAGLGLAYLGVATISDLGAPFVPRMNEVEVNLAVLAFTLTVGVLAGVVAGLAPVLQIPWRRIGEFVREGGHFSTSGLRSGRLRQGLVIGEIALALTVVTAAGLLVRSMVSLEHEDLGFRTQGVLTFRLHLPEATYEDSGSVGTFFDRLESRLRNHPGVTGVGISTSLPPNELGMTNNYSVEGQEPGPGEIQPSVEWLQASEGYFEALGIPLVYGRPFTDADGPGAPPAVIVNTAFVRRHFPDGEAVGRQIQGGNYDPDGDWMTVVGVVGDVPYESGAAGGVHPTIYTAYRANPWRRPYLSVQTTMAEPSRMSPEIRSIVHDLDPRLPLRDVATMEERVRRSEAAARFRTQLFTLLAFVSLVLATTGIYGVMAYNVSQRRRETAIRMALGADAKKTLKSVLGQGLKISALGVALGLAGALALSRSLSSLLYEVSPLDAPTFVGAATLLVVVALAASLLPALTAVRTEPATVLRDD